MKPTLLKIFAFASVAILISSVMAAIVLLAGCSPSPTIQETDSPVVTMIPIGGYGFREIGYKGHAYVSYNHGLIHATHCQCLGATVWRMTP
jgi:hypothetical protein